VLEFDLDYGSGKKRKVKFFFREGERVMIRKFEEFFPTMTQFDLYLVASGCGGPLTGGFRFRLPGENDKFIFARGGFFNSSD
jgi:hypothetical protein